MSEGYESRTCSCRIPDLINSGDEHLGRIYAGTLTPARGIIALRGVDL